MMTTNFDFVSTIFDAMSDFKNEIDSKLTNETTIKVNISFRLSETHGTMII